MLPQLSSQNLIFFVMAFVPAMVGIILHEIAHGWAAWRMGDPTARMLGRLTLNPVKHIDPMGLGVFAFTALFSPFVIGWAKPVPVQPRYFRNPRQGMMLVSVAGPLTNIFVAVGFALLAKILLNLSNAGILAGSQIASYVFSSMMYGVTINMSLAWFNLMPIPPLDGSHIVEGLLPPQLAMRYASLGRYGMIIIIAMVALGFFRYVIAPLIISSSSAIYNIVGLPGIF